jgi:hypothetical protein
MKTKAEAAANPQAGDRWRDDAWTVHLVTAFCAPGESMEWPKGVVTVFGAYYSREYSFGGGWQRFTENAEFLGGADE